jgi:hypothetical protein
MVFFNGKKIVRNESENDRNDSNTLYIQNVKNSIKFAKIFA